jgi:hypothetical protein
VGESFRQQPPAFKQIQQAFADQSTATLAHCAYLDDVASYRQLLASADVVLSTALHDFQGLSVLEAVAAGCMPLVPDRLCYPQWFPATCRYASDIDNPEREAQSLVAQVMVLLDDKKTGTLMAAPTVEQLGWTRIKPDYHRLLTM